ncbi:MAG: phosphatase PAP2 family protein [archaeon]|nr:phosphatase PAP2 family protein [archaeon]
MAGLLETVNWFDVWFLQTVQTALSPWLVSLALAVTLLGNPLLWILIAITVYWHGRETESFYLMNVALFSSIVVGALKLAIARPRPNPEIFNAIATDTYTGLSFPSGHSALIAAYWAYLRKFLNKKKDFLFLAVVLLVGLSRIYLGVHFLSDVVAGIVFGVAIGRWNLWLKEKVKHSHFKPSRLFDSLIIAGILLFSLLALSFLESIPLAAIFLGFYAGFFLSKEFNLRVENLSFKDGMVRTIIGFAGIAIILMLLPIITSISLPSQEFGATRTFLLLGLVGFWGSFLFPLLCSKFKKPKA